MAAHRWAACLLLMRQNSTSGTTGCLGWGGKKGLWQLAGQLGLTEVEIAGGCLGQNGAVDGTDLDLQTMTAKGRAGELELGGRILDRELRSVE